MKRPILGGVSESKVQTSQPTAMTGSIRKVVLGMLAGAVASAPLALSLGHPRPSVALGVAIGVAYAVSARRTPAGLR
jgi:hypothetical protein